DVPPEAPKDKSSALEPARILPMPARGGHASLEAVRGIKTAAADISPSKPEETPAADKSEPGAIAAPTTPVEVQQTGTITRPSTGRRGRGRFAVLAWPGLILGAIRSARKSPLPPYGEGGACQHGACRSTGSRPTGFGHERRVPSHKASAAIRL